MEEDQTYLYFKKALADWIRRKKREKEPYQSILAIDTNCHPGTMSKLLNPSRKKPIPYEKQVGIANACGYSYLDFLLLGQRLHEGKTGRDDKKNIDCDNCKQCKELEKSYERLEKDYNRLDKQIDRLLEEQSEDKEQKNELPKTGTYTI